MTGASEWLEHTLQLALERKASDIHVDPCPEGYQVRFRIDGQLVLVPDVPACDGGMIQRIKVLAGMDIAERRIPQDGSFHGEVAGRSDVDIRVSTLPTLYGEKVVMRLLRHQVEIIHLTDLGMEAVDQERLLWLLQAPQGLFLVTGATGSGKSTTLYAVLRHLAHTRRSIITLEDPIECRITGITQVQINNRAGLTFARGLRAALRQDPNIIMVGEIRDEETAEIAVRASLTGHLVLSTLHTAHAEGAFLRLVEFGISPRLVGASLLGVLTQKLVQIPCPHCQGESGECPRCRGTGTSGRRGVFQLTIMQEETNRWWMDGRFGQGKMRDVYSGGIPLWCETVHDGGMNTGSRAFVRGWLD